MHIDTYPLSVCVYPKTEKDLHLLIQFSGRYAKKNMVKDPRTGEMRITEVVNHVFANKDKTEIRFLRTMFGEFQSLLQLFGYKEGVNYTVTDHVFNYPLSDKVPTIFEEYQPRDEQPALLEFIRQFELGPILMHLVTGGGKAEWHETPIYTERGKIRFGDIKIGDKVYNEHGQLVTVTNVIPQGKLPAYKVTLRDKREVICNSEHLFTVIDYKQKRRTLKTSEIADIVNGAHPNQSNRRLYLPLTRPVEFDEQTLPIPPYVLGVLIGDGSYTQPSITICNPDIHIINKVDELLSGMGYYLKRCHPKEITYRISPIGGGKNPFKPLLDKLGIQGQHSHEKCVPDVYLHGSVEQRLELIRGLIDTDGYVGEHGNITFTTTSRRLAEEMKFLIYSVGGMAYVSNKQKYYTHKGTKLPGKPSYDVYIRHKTPSILVSLPKKLKRCDYVNQYSLTMKNQIMSVEKLDEDLEMSCITVDNPSHLYLTNDFVVTHNSLSSMFHIQERKSRFVAIMRPKYIGGAGDESGDETGWVKSFKKSYDITEDEIYIVAGSQSLKQLIQECLDKTDKYKAILISNKTIISYINSFRRKSKEEFEADGWKCTPFDLPRLLGVDTIVSDEIHLDYHQQCILMSYLGVNRLLGASATPSPDDRFVDRMLRLLYPIDRRYVQKSHTAYIQPTCYRYRFKNPKAIRCETFRGYTHIGFEQSIMRQTRLKEAYFNLIAEAIEIFYIRKLQVNPDYCCVVMVATIKLARELTDYLSKKYPDYTIKSFVENDPSSNLYYSQICVSTVLGSGTAHDIPNLATVFLTNNISSTQTNLQVAGRLRKLPDGRTPDLVYFISENIKKHRIYDYKKRNETFKDNLLPVNDYYTNKEI